MKRFAIAAVVMLTACRSGIPDGGWEKAGSTADEFARDRGQCVSQAFAAPTSFQQSAILIGCMQGKGWYWQERGKT